MTNVKYVLNLNPLRNHAKVYKREFELCWRCLHVAKFEGYIGGLQLSSASRSEVVEQSETLMISSWMFSFILKED